MSYMKNYLMDVMAEMGEDEITEEVLTEANRRLGVTVEPDGTPIPEKVDKET